MPVKQDSFDFELKNVNVENKLYQLCDQIRKQIIIRHNELQDQELKLDFYYYSQALQKECKLSSIQEQFKSIQIQVYVNQEDFNHQEEQELCPIELLPIIQRIGYVTIPSKVELSRMTIEQIKKVKNFIIYNNYGKIQFLEEVNLIRENIDMNIIIGMKSVEVYPQSQYCSQALRKPKIGEKLNTRALITFFEMFTDCDYYSEQKQLNKYIKRADKQGLKFVTFDPNTKHITFSVEHF